MYFDEFKHQLPDIDEAETQDWLDSLDQVVDQEGENRARFLMFKLLKRARQRHVGLPSLTSTRYINTISPEQEPFFPGDEELERRIRRLVRWNAVAMVLRGNNRFPGLGGHLATYASAASLYEVGFNHFFKGKDDPGGGDQVFFQGHAAPGIYARAFLEGRLSEDQLDHFRREVGGNGLSSYPHPRLMPEFWEFPTVSMGLGPLASVYQARFNRYLQNRGIRDTSQQRVWAFLGDGEMDEPESIAGISLAARDGLDNLTFVINCNLQRLDGPVRGNGKVIQELEGLFRGAGWNVIKVVWGREWDELLARDVDGVLVEKMNETLDGEFQKYSVSSGDYVREHFFGPDPRLRRIVEHLSDDDILKLRRGGHDYRKVYAAYKAATEYVGAPTVILAKTVKGWTLGPGVEARNITHQAKKLNEAELKVFRDRLELPIPDDQLKDAPYFHPGPDSEEVQYLQERRKLLGGPLPRRVVRAAAAAQARACGRRRVRVRQPDRRLDDDGVRPDPAQPDPRPERRQADRADHPGRGADVRHGPPVQGGRHLRRQRPALRPGRLGPRAVVSRVAGRPGARGGDQRGGLDGVADRRRDLVRDPRRADDPVLHLLFDVRVPADGRPGLGVRGPARARVHDRRHRRTDDAHRRGPPARRRPQPHPGLDRSGGPRLRPGFRLRAGGGRSATASSGCTTTARTSSTTSRSTTRTTRSRRSPTGVDDGIVRGIYRLDAAPDVDDAKGRVRLVGSGSILQQVLAARDLLANELGIAAEIYSATSFQQLRHEAVQVERWNRLHPDKTPRVPYVSQVLGPDGGPIVVATDWVRTLPDLVAPWVPDPYIVLGTDGFGRSDTRESLRAHFEIDPPHIAAAALAGLARCGSIDARQAAKSIRALGVDPETSDPLTR